MKRLLLTLLCLLLLPCYSCFADEPIQLARMNPWVAGSAASSCANSCSGNYGNTWTDGTETFLAADEIHLYKIELTSGCAGSNPTIHEYIKDVTVSNFKMLIYDDDGAEGEPGTLLYVSDATSTVNGTQWFAISSSIACLKGTNGSVYVGFVGDGGTTVFYKSTGTSRRKTVSGYYTSPPDPWPNATDTHSDTARGFYISW